MHVKGLERRGQGCSPHLSRSALRALSQCIVNMAAPPPASYSSPWELGVHIGGGFQGEHIKLQTTPVCPTPVRDLKDEMVSASTLCSHLPPRRAVQTPEARTSCRRPATTGSAAVGWTECRTDAHMHMLSAPP